MPFSSSAREPHNFLPELLLVFILQRLSSPEALCLLSASESHLREQPSFYCAVFSLFSPSPCILYLYSFGLTSFFLHFLFLSVVPSMKHRHSLWLRDWVSEGNTWSKTVLVPYAVRTKLVRAIPDQKTTSILCVARTGLVPQHLMKTTGWLSSGLWKIGLERLSPDQK